METYKAVITEPGKSAPKADRYGTVTIPGQATMSSVSLDTLRVWARLVLPSCSKGAYCTFYKMEQVEIERITQEDLVNAPANR